MPAAAALQASGAARAAKGVSRTIRQDRMRIMRVYFLVCIGGAKGINTGFRTFCGRRAGSKRTGERIERHGGSVACTSAQAGNCCKRFNATGSFACLSTRPYGRNATPRCKTRRCLVVGEGILFGIYKRLMNLF
jgi:hypothetical protein